MTHDGYKRVEEFWHWFLTAAPHFGEAFENEQLLAELDEKISSLGDFTWELGAGQVEPNALIISPHGDRNLLKETRAIVSRAPKVTGWEFHPAKLKKEWVPVFELNDAKDRPFLINAKHWRYALLKYPDGALEILVEAPNLAPLDDEYQRWAAEIVLDGLLGEQRRVETIDEISVTLKLDPKSAKGARPITGIADSLKERS